MFLQLIAVDTLAAFTLNEIPKQSRENHSTDHEESRKTPQETFAGKTDADFDYNLVGCFKRGGSTGRDGTVERLRCFGCAT
jgi:hypothetical protein